MFIGLNDRQARKAASAAKTPRTTQLRGRIFCPRRHELRPAVQPAVAEGDEVHAIRHEEIELPPAASASAVSASVPSQARVP
jgi:hypothetical protein